MIESWKFSYDDTECDYLLDLVIKGQKTATCSIYEGGDLPEVGEQSYIMDSKNNKRVLIELTNSFVEKFCNISEKFAAKESEGDLSLESWRATHKEFFTKELASCYHAEFSEDIILICEEFKISKILPL